MKQENKNIYLNRLRQQYKQLRKYKANETTSDNFWKQEDYYYDAMRLFCLDTDLLSFEDIELEDKFTNGIGSIIIKEETSTFVATGIIGKLKLIKFPPKNK